MCPPLDFIKYTASPTIIGGSVHPSLPVNSVMLEEP